MKGGILSHHLLAFRMDGKGEEMIPGYLTTWFRNRWEGQRDGIYYDDTTRPYGLLTADLFDSLNYSTFGTLWFVSCDGHGAGINPCAHPPTYATFPSHLSIKHPQVHPPHTRLITLSSVNSQQPAFHVPIHGHGQKPAFHVPIHGHGQVSPRRKET